MMFQQQYYQSIIKKKPKGEGFLDEVAGAYRAFSTRLVYSDYSGYCLRITDGTNVKDIGFVNSIIDIGSINDFISNFSPTIVTVDIWYDQSGSGRNWFRLSNGWRIWTSTDGFYTINNVPFLYANTSVSMFYTPSEYPSNLNFFYSSDFDNTETSLRNLISASAQTPAQSHGLISTQGSTNTTYHRNYGPPVLYKNKSLFSLSDRGDVYDLWNGAGVICEKDVDISFNWSPNDIVIGSATAGGSNGHRINDWIEFKEDMEFSKIETVSDKINLAYNFY
ncbi:hypothetical protein DN752_21030 [Echinicola strongylocentroti]|uniref:Uncharacterized protein n=1 Tax=Echinicola strongylocentroti TaxID=1795355 RepID=A0A2Z4INR8_9BACT|nr:hypothetical protein [Echinicola strongylocentroti]AWW32427.1 hypothetical protein DN752_21030 [Echinicola strongylocentroti]